MNLIALISQIPQATWFAFIISVVIPGLSAALVRAHWDASITGFFTVGLSTGTGFVTEWARDGSVFHWQIALALSLGSWFIAGLAQSKIFSGTNLESWLLSLGTHLQGLETELDTSGPSDPTLGMSADDEVAIEPQPVADVPVPEPKPAEPNPTV